MSFITFSYVLSIVHYPVIPHITKQYIYIIPTTVRSPTMVLTNIVYIYTYIHTHIYIHIYTHTYIYTHNYWHIINGAIFSIPESPSLSSDVGHTQSLRRNRGTGSTTTAQLLLSARSRAGDREMGKITRISWEFPNFWGNQPLPLLSFAPEIWQLKKEQEHLRNILIC